MTDGPRALSIPLPSHDILQSDSWLANLTKAIRAEERQASNQGNLMGRIMPLIDYTAVAKLREHNVHHSAALDAKTNSMVGLGHREAAIAKELNPLTLTSWNEVQEAWVSDFNEYANGFLEIVRNDEGNIRGIHHLPAKDVFVYLEEARDQFHYEIANQREISLTNVLSGLRFARYGDQEDFIQRRKIPAEKRALVSEVIHLHDGRGLRSPYYGFPKWVSAVPSMEVDHCVMQYIFDFFFNGGVPEGIYSVIGQQLADEDFNKIKEEFQNHVGLKNRRKIMLLNLGAELTIDFQKLTLDGQTTGDNQPMVDAQALKILSAHRTPPILAGVTPPGKMGANNETTNALLLFQLLVVGPAQKRISQLLADTLGNPELNGDLNLTAAHFLGETVDEQEPDPLLAQSRLQSTDRLAMRKKDFRGNGYNTILDEIDLGKADTMGRMRMSNAEAQFRGRDMSAGAAERGSDVAAGRGDSA